MLSPSLKSEDVRKKKKKASDVSSTTTKLPRNAVC